MNPGGQPVWVQRIVSGPDNLSKIDHGMTCHREGDFGLVAAQIVHPGDDQGTRVEDRSESAQPGLVAVLRTKKAERRVRDVALQNLTRPALPLAQNLVELDLLRPISKPAQQFRRRGRRSGARVQKRNLDLAT